MRRTSPSARPRRRGQLIPMVGVILVLFGFLAFGFMFRSQSNTSITGISIYGMQAHQLALAFADEAKLALMNSFDELDGSAPWKNELRDMLRDQADGPSVTLDRPDFQGELPNAMSLLGSVANAELMECSLRLHGFHRLHYAANDIYDSETSFYKSEFLDPDDTARMPVDDWVGYATIQVRVSIRGIERQVQVTHDLKVVDVQPPAREFAFMAWAPVTQEMADSGLAHASLNQGGSMAIFPNDVGRVMIRGPYPLIVEGLPNGDGGERRPGEIRESLSYPDNDDDWHGWSVIPGNRALLWNQLAMPWGSNIRPDKDGTFVKARVRYPTKDFVSVDTNTSVVDCVSQSYYCGATEVGKQAFSPWGRPGGDGGFSMFRGFKVDFNNGGQVTGAYESPGNNFGGGSNGDGITFEGGGVYAVLNQANFKNNFGIYACFSFTPSWPPSCFGADTYSGFSALGGGPCLIGLPCIGMMLGDMNHSPSIDPATYSGGTGGRYLRTLWALRYWEEEAVSIWASLIGAAVSYVAASYTDGTLFEGGAGDAAGGAAADAAGGAAGDAAGGAAGDAAGGAAGDAAGGAAGDAAGGAAGDAAGGAAGGAAGDAAAGAASEATWGALWESTKSNFQSDVFMKTVGKEMMASIAANTYGTIKPGATGAEYPSAGELADSAPQGLFPPKFREYMRGATRLHRNLDEALDQDGQNLNLDGIVLVETMDRPSGGIAEFTYRGRGVLVSMTDGTANQNPIVGTVTPEDGGQDWLTLAHFVKREPLPDGGDCQINLQTTEFIGSLYSKEGVIAEADAAIFGNYVCAWPNKYKVVDGARFDVFYNYERLAPSRFGGPGDDEWTDWSWKRVVVSPKVSGYYDRYR